MTLKSMTGFARASGSHATWRWSWEIKTVNAKGLDLRVRVPHGFDAIEQDVKAHAGRRLSRGACYANLTAQRHAGAPEEVRINQAALLALQNALAQLPPSARLRPASLDGLLAIRGIVDVVEAVDAEDTMKAVQEAALASLDAGLAELVAMRETEGRALQTILGQRLGTIARLSKAAEDCPGRKPEAVRERLVRSVADLMGAAPALDPARLHQEAILMAAKADVREELDRLAAHVAAARDLIVSDQPVGRKLDFLAQELAREANTLCSKSNDPALTSIGVELRVEIEQFREQVQNIE